MIAFKKSSILTPVVSAALALGLLSACSPQSPTVNSTPEATEPEVVVPSAEIAKPLPIGDAIVKFGPALPQALQGSPAQSGGECGIEATAEVPQGGQLSFSRSRPELIQGWAVYREDKTPPSSVYLKLASGGDASYFALVTMESRAGLGVRLRDESLDNAAFKATLGLSDVPAGDYSVEVAQRVGDKILLCATGRTVEVSE